MHRILTEHPAYKQAVEQVARIKGAQFRHQQQLAKAEQEHRAAAAEYQREAIEALRDGREAPERPTPPEVDPALIQQLAQDTIEAPAIVRDAERRLAPELLPLLEARAFELEETIRQAADSLRGLAREASELRVTTAAHRAAAELPQLVDQGAVDVARLFYLVTRGDPLLAAESATSATWDAGSWDPDAPRGSHRFASFGTLGGRR